MQKWLVVLTHPFNMFLLDLAVELELEIYFQISMDQKTKKPNPGFHFALTWNGSNHSLMGSNHN
jgi:hypothetical protein